MATQDPKTTRYMDWHWHTVDTLRQLAREQADQVTELTARLGACDYLSRIEHTPGAWRIYGAIDHVISQGYDADHIIRWLEAGMAKEAA